MSNKSKSTILIRKASGEEEPFRMNKLKQSLRNAGAEEEVIEQVASDIESWITDGITTQKIYGRAFSLLRKKKKYAASRYKLKKAIMELGPTGYPFEHFIGKVLEVQGFKTEVGQVVNGKCVTHEVDVIATRNNEQYFVECKYGTSQGKVFNVQVPLYIRSRVNDIIEKCKEDEKYNGFNFYGWVVTNTRFSSDAIDYGTCSGLNLLSWDFPTNKGLKDIIDRDKIFPITVLHNLTKAQKQELMDNGIVICRQIREKPEVLEPFQFKSTKLNSLMKEIDDLS
ncbi:MAG TPA: ATP-binding protein [Mariniphaga anaerophila]|uniref:ATP-binding protein n=1 Tax=Mariniphaga anaerophila TaxID=1484053 RepID=A0A831LE17_9BACT|nr:ATP-binding protein [Mariniphaga anaerophila]